MNIGCPAAKGIYQQHVNESYDRCVFAYPGKGRKIDFFVVFKYLNVFRTIIVELNGIQRNKIGARNTPTVRTFAVNRFENNLIHGDGRQLNLSRSSVVLGDSLLNACFGNHHRFDVQAGHELYVVHRKHIGRVDHCEREAGTDT